MSTKRQLKIDLSELIFAFDTHLSELQQYLDRETGDIVAVSDEDRMILDRLFKNGLPEDFGTVERRIRTADLPDWQRETALTATRVEMDYEKERYLLIPQSSSREGYRDMEDFIDTIEDHQLREKLEIAISSKGAFRRFKDVLAYHSDQRENWFQFRGVRLKARVLEWLESEDIELIEG